MKNNRGVLPELSDKELVERKGSTVFFDIEIYDNYLLFLFYFPDGEIVYFEGTEFNKKKLQWMLMNFEIVTFNGINYDIPLTWYFLTKEPSINEMFEKGSELIRGYPVWKFYKDYNLPNMRINHIDIMEVAIGKHSLKTYAGRTHAPYMQDLPYPAGSVLTEEQKTKVLKYCRNDGINTKWVYDYLEPDINLRRELSIQYSADVRSKSDAQIAEVVIARELEWRHGIQVSKSKREEGYTWKYNVPDNIRFRTPYMQQVLKDIENTEFKWNGNGTITYSGGLEKYDNPKKGRVVQIGNLGYTMGIGGLHSTEKNVTHKSDSSYVLIDRDVTSYYPFIILNQGLYPKHLGKAFLDVYRGIVQRRIEAKAAGDKRTANTLKIVINGSFGKFGSEYSFLFSPELLIQTTVSGQLYLLMYIERLVMNDFEVVSANTDGVVTKVDRERRELFEKIVSWWEKITGFGTEETEYATLCSRDVNNYIAITPDGNTKSKGYYAESPGFGISKNPSGEIVFDAVREYLKNGTPVEETIENCKDIRKFVYVRKVDGGAIDIDGNLIGKVIRYYYRKGQFVPLRYKSNGNKVPKSSGAYPIMDFSVDFPQDIDYSFYSYEAKKILNSDFSKPEQLDLF